MPALRIAALLGTHYQNAAFEVVPPMLPAFSRITALLPCQRANSAEARPPQPLPQTTMSYSPSNFRSAAAALSALKPKAAAAAAAEPAPARWMNRRRDASCFSLIDVSCSWRRRVGWASAHHSRRAPKSGGLKPTLGIKTSPGLRVLHP